MKRRVTTENKSLLEASGSKRAPVQQHLAMHKPP